jgi:hypothetical protein
MKKPPGLFGTGGLGHDPLLTDRLRGTKKPWPEDCAQADSPDFLKQR